MKTPNYTAPPGSGFGARCTILLIVLTTLNPETNGQTHLITELFDDAAGDVVDTWEISRLESGGSATLTDISSLGGNLQSNIPSGSTGALRLSTGLNNSDVAEISTYRNFGDAATVLQSLNVSYSYYKQSVSGGNVFAAPALKITVHSATGTGDNYGQLVYEPTWNQPTTGSQPAPTDAWQSVSINSATGASSDASGGWWWTGGFEIANSSGGPPLRSLGEWVAALQASDSLDFSTSQVTALTLGVGTFNQGQIGYVDSLSIAHSGGFNTTYNFSVSAVPEPASAAFGFGLLALVAAGLRRSRYRKSS